MCSLHGSNPHAQSSRFSGNGSQGEGTGSSNVPRTEAVTAWRRPSEKPLCSRVWAPHRDTHGEPQRGRGGPGGKRPQRRPEERTRGAARGRGEGLAVRAEMRARPRPHAVTSSATIPTARPAWLLGPVAAASPGRTHPGGLSSPYLPANEQPE